MTSHDLIDEQRLGTFNRCLDYYRLSQQSDPFVDRIFTCDENCCLYSNRKRTAMWMGQRRAVQQFPETRPPPEEGNVVSVVVRQRHRPVQLSRSGKTYHTAHIYSREMEEAYNKLKIMCPTKRSAGKGCLGMDGHLQYSLDLSPTDYDLSCVLTAFPRQMRMVTTIHL
ncbi:hypothetical protein M514_08052 [Trichuris suis]|uniref:Uncharacterized protein n=1 Tax=Trichuris suis TaxID=68888 RepID=A0A085M1B5_9BILA|nr:hypothetical protein M513_08052 [Trichuris suis]KFD73225.1 hypothetical protein M514_08052 [Trichuris suis]